MARFILVIFAFCVFFPLKSETYLQVSSSSEQCSMWGTCKKVEYDCRNEECQVIVDGSTKTCSIESGNGIAIQNKNGIIRYSTGNAVWRELCNNAHSLKNKHLAVGGILILFFLTL